MKAYETDDKTVNIVECSNAQIVPIAKITMNALDAMAADSLFAELLTMS
jgi:hypothetical protein